MIPPLSNYIKRPLDAELENRVSEAEQSVEQIDTKISSIIETKMTEEVYPTIESKVEESISTVIEEAKEEGIISSPDWGGID